MRQGLEIIVGTSINTELILKKVDREKMEKVLIKKIEAAIKDGLMELGDPEPNQILRFIEFDENGFI